MVAPDAGCGELIQDILGLMAGHQTHTKQGEAETQTDTTDIVTDIVTDYSYISDMHQKTRK